MSKAFALFVVILMFAGGGVRNSFAQTSVDHSDQLTPLNYLLAIDRLDYYSDALADHIMEHGQPEAAAALRKIQPETFQKQKISMLDLSSPILWNALILKTLQQEYPQFQKLTLKDIEWNYNFFRNKLMEGFKADLITLKKDNSVSDLDHEEVSFNKRSIPNVNSKRILLDAERYISEKTTRALFWDAALTGKSVELHMGTERDFRQRIAKEDRDVIAEVKTRAHNYNKIYLVYNPATKEYSYAFTRISGDDRVKHLISQLRILKYEDKVVLKDGFVKVYGNANQVHRQQEQSLLELFNSLPKADVVIIGQKSAVSNVIAMAGMMAQIQPNIAMSVGDDKSPLQKLSEKVKESGSYFSVTSKGSVVKAEFEELHTPLISNYELFTSEQPSHDISDVLLETKSGKLVRWRIISNMWGDEVVPLARALRFSGHKKVIYIGTAGGLIGKGLKVGDVVSPSQTYTQQGKLLALETPSYGHNFVKTGMVLGQVTSPFDETESWFNRWKSKIDVVELETGYLKENLGPDVSFQPYLLVSDVVGSEHESLAVAASDSSKRKNGQMKLLEDIFIANNIKAAVSNVEMISSEPEIARMYHKIDTLRPSRDMTSKAQLTQLALRQNIKSDADLEKLIKSEPVFDRQLLMDKLEKYSSAVDLLAKRFALLNVYIVGSDEFFNGTWNPKKPLKLTLMVHTMEASSVDFVYRIELAQIKNSFGNELQIEVVDFDAQKASTALMASSETHHVLVNYYEEKILKKFGFNKEIDKNGGIRFREIPETTTGGGSCKNVFM